MQKEGEQTWNASEINRTCVLYELHVMLFLKKGVLSKK